MKRLVRNMGSRRMQAVFALILIFPCFSALAAESSFVSLKLPRGIEIQIPKGWRFLNEEHQKIISTVVEATIDLTGIEPPPGKTTNLVAAYSIPKSTYASVRIDSTVPTDTMPADLSSLTPADIRPMEKEGHDLMKRIVSVQGFQLLNFYGVKLEYISGYPALVTSYSRTGPKGPVIVQLNRVTTGKQEAAINLAYREAEPIWKPVIGKIRKSIVIRPWP